MPLRNILILVAVLLLIALAAPRRERGAAVPLPAAPTLTAGQEAGRASADASALYRVTRVIDGDTIAIDMNGVGVTVRLIGLDTPETVDPRRPVQCFGEEASRKAEEILAGRSVRLEMDGAQSAYDKYGRLLAYVFLEDGTLFNQLIIEEGYGHEYTYNLPYKYQSEFKQAETKAREQKKGLWAPGACAPGATYAPPPRKMTGGTAGETYDCTRNAYNCTDFSSQAEAQYVFELCGGGANDIHLLDRDRDGRVCEGLP